MGKANTVATQHNPGQKLNLYGVIFNGSNCRTWWLLFTDSKCDSMGSYGTHSTRPINKPPQQKQLNVIPYEHHTTYTI